MKVLEKSSLLRVISGNFSDFSGAILINNIPIGNYQLETLRSKMGVYLNQQDIFKGTVWENISMNRQGILPENATKIAENLGIQSYLDTLQQGFETEIDSAGKKLPSTIVKKILLLRAFANEPNLLLLEEPWQGLEEAEKEKMVSHLLNMIPNTTIIVVSNDVAFAQKCDYHFQLENGKIV